MICSGHTRIRAIGTNATDELFRAKPPRVDKKVRTIRRVKSLKKSEDTFQVSWTETVFTKTGQKLRETEQTALLTVTQHQGEPTEGNPANLFVVFFD